MSPESGVLGAYANSKGPYQFAQLPSLISYLCGCKYKSAMVKVET